MAARCCRDSVAMHLRKIDFKPVEGELVPCRWSGNLCTDGYGIYLNGLWEYHDAVGDFIERETSPEAQAKRDELRARIRVVK